MTKGIVRWAICAWLIIPGLLIANTALTQEPVAVDQPPLPPLTYTESTGAPPELERWKSWVLYGREDRFCPTVYNDGGISICAWPSQLELTVDDGGGKFTQTWMILAETWANLPGNLAVWPDKVLVNGRSVPVLNRDGTPAVKLLPGEYRVEGSFEWREIPETIRIPPACGLLSLAINGRTVDFPVLDQNGRLWLQKRVEPQGQEDRLEVRIQRLLTDSIPMETVNLLKIDVSGRTREITLKKVLLPGAEPMRLLCPLPARLGPDGELKIQARPGRWEIRVVTRFEGPVNELGPTAGEYGQEIWAFKPQNHLRLVKIEGVPSVDPGQTDVPDDWREYSTYLVDPGSTMQLVTIRRGNPDPAPDRLNLRRTWWLDFNGRGFTIQDAISGTMSRHWSLMMNPPGILGRVSINGRDQLITLQGKEKKAGVELRQGALNLTADSRYEESVSHVPAVGWDHDFQEVTGTLNLPPGWRLLTAGGVDVLPGTWLERWDLLDLFIVLIIAVVVFKLLNWAWGLLALVTLALIYHEPGAPGYVWLSLLAATALWRVLPEGWARKLAGLWRLASIIVLLAISIPFMVTQARVGLYPQLDYPVKRHYGRTVRMPTTGALMQEPEEGGANRMYKGDDIQQLASSAPKKKAAYYQRKQAVMTQDPNALIQTGPGLPAWNWRSLNMKWNGPVYPDQRVRLWLLGPKTNLVLAFLRVLLLAVLIVGLIDFRRWWRNLDKKPKPALAAAAALALFLAPGLVSAQSTDPCFPPAEVLREFQERLLEKPDCLPFCAHFPRMDLTATPDNLTIILEVHAATRTAVPLPGASDSWHPNQVMLDGRPSQGLYRDKDGLLWLMAPSGTHTVVLIGRTNPGNTFQIPLPLRPARVLVTAEGWEVAGVSPEGRVEANLQLTRLKRGDAKEESFTSGVLPPFLHVERIISLGLTWQVFTTINRLTPTGAPVVISVPLLPGEALTTAGVRVANGRALINMDPKTKTVQWSSTLEVSPELVLQSPESVPWTETWILDASPIWHCELSGIPVVHHQDEEGSWRPQWRPWPGETVRIAVSRPKAIPGQTLTIDTAALELTIGERFTKAGLDMTIRASQGGQHRVVLPEGARLQQVRVNDKSQPIGQEERTVVLPLQPGSQKIHLEWNQQVTSTTFLKGPEVKIGDQAVNASVTYHLPRNRWILWTSGPRLGPAVLFWSYLVVVILAALALGRLGRTPLKTRHWLLLSLGLTQVHPLGAIVIVGWLLILDYRYKKATSENWFLFDLFQLFLAIFTAVALIILYQAVEKGLLGIPLMQIAGNSSTDFNLIWTQDRIGAHMPRPWVISLPLLVYRGLMLIWALWLALALTRWLRWGWEAFSEGGFWKNPRLKRGQKKAGTDEFLIE